MAAYIYAYVKNVAATSSSVVPPISSVRTIPEMQKIHSMFKGYIQIPYPKLVKRSKSTKHTPPPIPSTEYSNCTCTAQIQKKTQLNIKLNHIQKVNQNRGRCRPFAQLPLDLQRQRTTFGDRKKWGIRSEKEKNRRRWKIGTTEKEWDRHSDRQIRDRDREGYIMSYQKLVLEINEKPGSIYDNMPKIGSI
ncbi:hypothetical protein LXL04_016586 [Taraxacum kok-saghyz]